MHLSIQNIHSDFTGDFPTQINSIIEKIKYFASDLELKKRIVKMTIFSSCDDNSDYIFKIKILNDIFGSFEIFKAPYSLISQPSMNNGVVIEVWILNYEKGDFRFKFIREEQFSVLVVECKEFSCLFSNQFSAINNKFRENVQETFNLINSTLNKEGFEFNDIVRQWNYIENITNLDSTKAELFQNYQMFNDLRSLYYDNSNFPNGFPSATGIGVANGGCTIELIALKEKIRKSVKPVTNSLQIDAHAYTSNVLIGKSIEELSKISTPKFERGKYMHFGEDGFVFISGTASIVGEETVFTNDVSKQTITTLQIIDHLISVNNLENNNINVISSPTPINYRVYLKNESDYTVVKLLCDAYFGTLNGIFVKADICRSNLLVEIEANYRV